MINKHIPTLPDFELRELTQSMDPETVSAAVEETARRRRMAGGSSLALFKEAKPESDEEQAD